MQRLLICCAVGLGLLFGAFAPIPASAYYYHHHYYHHRHYYPYYHHPITITPITITAITITATTAISVRRRSWSYELS
jgi:hypothetical protein